MSKCSMGLLALSSLFLSGAAIAQEKIKVGVTATLEGTYTVLGEDGMRGHQTALNVLGKKVGDKELEFIVASTDATPDSAVRAVRKLIEQDKVQILLSPLSGDEGIAATSVDPAPVASGSVILTSVAAPSPSQVRKASLGPSVSRRRTSSCPPCSPASTAKVGRTSARPASMAPYWAARSASSASSPGWRGISHPQRTTLPLPTIRI